MEVFIINKIIINYKTVDNLILQMSNQGFKANTIKIYVRTLNRFIYFCNQKGIDYYEDNYLYNYIENQSKKKYKTENYFKHICLVLKDFLKTNQFRAFKTTNRIDLIYRTFECLLKEYLEMEEFKKLSNLTIIKKRIVIISFLNYLGSININNIKNCRQKDIFDYLNSINNLSSSTKSGILFVFRHFFNFLYSMNYIMYSGNELFPVIFTNKRDRILSFYSNEEINSVIELIDNTTVNGKRDLIIILLASQLGIRSGDIVRLKLNNIHWERKTIEFSQFKTKEVIQLPLLDNIKFSLIDYLKNSRPKSISEFIFIARKNEGKPYSNTSIHHIVSKYFKKAEVDISKRRHGPHALRHSLASNLLNNNTPMHIISDILGHSSLNSTQIYLNIDLDKLKLVALEVAPYEEN